MINENATSASSDEPAGPAAHRWSRAVAGALLSGVLLLVGCSTSPEPTDASPSTSSDAAFPVSVEHTFGTATIPAKPQRVVVLGVTDVDTVLALGTTPVATTGYAFFPDRLGPWAEPLVAGAMPEVLPSDAEPNLEKIAALAPDLIVGVSAGFDDGV